MKALIIIGIVTAAIALIMLMRIAALIVYSADGFELSAYFGPFRVKIIPADSRKKGRKKRGKRFKKEKAKANKEKKAKAEKEKRGGKIKPFTDILPIISESLGKLKRKLTINTLVLHYTAAGDNVALTALSYGYASFGAGLILPVLENNFKIKKKDVKTSVSFTESESRVFVRARFSIAVASILYIALIFIFKYFKLKNEQERNETHGKAPNRRFNGNNHEENTRDD